MCSGMKMTHFEYGTILLNIQSQNNYTTNIIPKNGTSEQKQRSTFMDLHFQNVKWPFVCICLCWK
jgi:hypothetical protein